MIVPFTQNTKGNSIIQIWEIGQTAHGTLLINTGAASSWTAVSCFGPPTAIEIVLGDSGLYIRKRAQGESVVSRNMQGGGAAGSAGSSSYFCACDGTQTIEYAQGSAKGNLNQIGFREMI